MKLPYIVLLCKLHGEVVQGIWPPSTGVHADV